MTTYQVFYDTQLTSEVKKYSTDLDQFIPAAGSVVSGSCTYTQTFNGTATGSAAVSITGGSIGTFTSPALSGTGVYQFVTSYTLSDSQIRKTVHLVHIDM
jgi:hypothetical protein